MDTIKRILFPTDFSAASTEAKQMAALLRDQFGCALDVIHVYDPSALSMPIPYNTLPGVDQWVDNHFDVFRKQGRQALEELCPELGNNCSSAFLEGQPGPVIVDYAAKHEIDLIVIGTHGHRGLQRLLMGSVAEYVLRHATCPVLRVKGAS